MAKIRKDLTSRQLEVLRYMQRFRAKYKINPTHGEIGFHFGTTAPNICVMLKRLAKHNYVKIGPFEHRNYTVNGRRLKNL